MDRNDTHGMDRRAFIKVAGIAAVGLANSACQGSWAQDSTHGEAPEAQPGGKRLAMAIDLKKCHEAGDCQDCVNACNLAHNIPEFDNKKDEIKWIWKEAFEHAFHEQENEYAAAELKHKPALLMCNHCDNPPCVRVCPTQATWKRETDGVVMMDWHRCIGCRYCVAACPYGSRSFNWKDPRPNIKSLNHTYPTRTRGVVEKCTFCDERLAKGKRPACVEACKKQALVFGDLEDGNSEIRKVLGENFTIRRKPALGTQPEVYYLV